MSDDAYAVVMNGRTHAEMYAAQKLIQEVRAEQADEIERLRAALRELLWYTNQLEINVYDPDEWPKVHEAVKTARAALEEK